MTSTIGRPSTAARRRGNTAELRKAQPHRPLGLAHDVPYRVHPPTAAASRRLGKRHTIAICLLARPLTIVACHNTVEGT